MTLQEFQKLTSQWTKTATAKLFGEIVSAALTFTSATQLAVHFEISETVLEFWASGHATPSQWRTDYVVSELQKLAITAARAGGLTR